MLIAILNWNPCHYNSYKSGKFDPDKGIFFGVVYVHYFAVNFTYLFLETINLMT